MRMKALHEIGIRKAVKFGCMTLFLLLYRLMIFPQLRRPFLRMLGAKVGKNTVIHRVDFFNHYRKGFPAITLGNDCFLGDGTILDLADTIHVEDQVTIAERVTILTHTNVGYIDHPLQGFFPSFTSPVTIKAGSFVGACVTILPGVRIGRQSFIAAGSVVTKDVPDHVLVGGVPAKVLRDLSDKLEHEPHTH
jgi:acetyltransferase-like isoleucine patch superfamily enzyme